MLKILFLMREQGGRGPIISGGQRARDGKEPQQEDAVGRRSDESKENVGKRGMSEDAEVSPKMV